jgi:polysaccharide export outer membrane protein
MLISATFDRSGEESTSSLEKRSKRRLRLRRGTQFEMGRVRQAGKVFWFFFSRKNMLSCFCLTALLATSACAWMPDDGPLLSDVEAEAKKSNPEFVLIPVDRSVVTAVNSTPAGGTAATNVLPDRTPLTIGAGDVLSIELYGAGPAGLFSAPGAEAASTSPNTPTVTQQVVDEDGNISFPFAGILHVGGLTIAEAQTELEAKLQPKMVEPQVSIHISTNASNVVTLTGVIKNPGRPALTAAHERIIDLISSAGGSTVLPTDTLIQLTRHGRTVAIPMQTLLDHPEQDFPADPGDVIDLINNPRTYLVMGAVDTDYGSTNKFAQEFPMNVPYLTLAAAVARAGGILDKTGNARAVFLMRTEPPEVLRRIPSVAGRIDTSVAHQVVYAFNMKRASGYFYANDFPMRPRDMVLVPDARLTEIKKVFDVITPLSGEATTGSVVSSH